MPSPELIPAIPVPDSIKKEMDSFLPELEKSFQHEEWDYSSGYGPNLHFNDFLLETYWETLGFISEINVMVENLNLIINDIRMISQKPEICNFIFEGRLAARYYLLVRTFFYETFRSKEIYNRYLKCLKRRRILRKKDVQDYQAQFLEVFDKIIKVRNKMVHQRFVFPGIEHRQLILAEDADQRNLAFVLYETGERVTTTEILKKLCEEFNEEAVLIGTGLARYLESFSLAVCEVAIKVKDGTVALSD